MRWVKQISPSYKRILFFLLFATVFLMTRIPELMVDEINPDAVNWHYRSEQFVVALKSGNLIGTYQHYHPGVTLMWITGLSVELLKQLSPQDRVYTHYNFEVFHFVSKYVLVFVQLVLLILILGVLSRTVDYKVTFFAVSLFTLEPFFLGNSRLLHLDVLLTLFLFLGLVLFYQSISQLRILKVFLAGIFFALAFLTKSIALGAVIFSVSHIILVFSFQKAWKKVISFNLVLLGSFMLTAFLLFPALWSSPTFVLTNIFKEGERVGIRKGHEQIVFGNEVNDGGILFYPLTLLLKFSPMTLLGVFLFIYYIVLKRRAEDFKTLITRPSLILFLGIFYAGYLIFLLFPTKKIDRYIIPVFPLLSLMAVHGYYRYVHVLKSIKAKAVFGVFVAFSIFLPALSYFPYYFLYTNPVFGSSKTANKIIAQKPFGIGVHNLKKFLLSNYGYYPRVGLTDTKPLKSIYPNSKIFDIRVNGSGDYDLIILGINEKMPDKVLKGKYEFEFDKSIYMNGLEYWRIYAKKK